MPQLKPNPFIYGPVVKAEQFINREDVLRTVLGRMGNPSYPQSTTIVGPPHSGKSSLLWKISSRAVQKEYLGDNSTGLDTCLLNLHHIPNDYTPQQFWYDALEPIRLRPGHAAVTRRIDQASQKGFTPQSMRTLLSYLADKRKRRLALVLDEFERLLIHPKFQDPGFFAGLRSLANNTGALALVAASRMSVAEMNTRGKNLLETGSPFFNNMIEARLLPFDDNAVEILFDQAPEAFSEEGKHFIRRMAGRSPFLLQAMAASLFEIDPEVEDRYALAADRFYNQISFHFDDLWNNLDERTGTTALMLCLAELGTRVFNQRFDTRQIKNQDAFAAQLKRLVDLGLVEVINEDGPLPWSGTRKRWRVSTLAFNVWVRDVVIAKTRPVKQYDQWLNKKCYRTFLTQEQWDKLTGLLQGTRHLIVASTAVFLAELLEETAGVYFP